MPDTDDISLLRDYADRGSQAAFAALVARHADLVYAAALRQVCDRAMAQDVTQAVFLILSQKARSLPRNSILPAWLWQVTRCAALSALRQENRIKARERRAIAMSSSTPAADESSWEHISPALDNALANLGAKDRTAIVLRFFQNQNLRQVAEAMGVSEDAAKQRVFRAIARLRKALLAKGVAVSVAGLGTHLSATATHAAPPQLHAALAASTTHATPLTIAKGALTLMAIAKAKSAALVAIVVLILAGAGVGIAIKLQPRPAVAAAKPATLPVTNWKDRFDAVYRLNDGEIVRRVAPPFIPERGDFLDTLDPRRKFADDASAYSFTWDSGIQSMAGPMNAITMRAMLDYILDVPAHRVELKPVQLDMRLSGDWIVRRGASEREKLTALSAILRRDWQITLAFEEQQAERNVLVARRANQTKPAALIHLFIRNRRNKTGVVEDNQAGLLRTLARLADLPVIDETKDAAAPVQWTFDDFTPDRLLAADELDPLLKNIADQTGLSFSRERRTVTIWKAD